MASRATQVVPLEDVVVECHDAKTYRFSADGEPRPGQFLMLWIPRRDEVPMAYSYLRNPMGITVREYGDATRALAAEAKKGYRVGVRGPYGNAFAIEGTRALAVAGGVGIASVIAAVEAFAEANIPIETAFGARTKDELMLLDRLKVAGAVHLATDDGTAGHHGFVTDVAAKLLAGGTFDMVLTCGPEVMMKKVVDAANGRGVPVQASLERYMKCGIGICDACVLDDRLVCADGPIFWGEALAESKDFGHWRRNICGQRVKA
ncbi:MAG: dihydroorotate dehydrogenase electron transfer subunit [Methanobacteriota archaeon]|nr:MAG: dihydroorotate dehydrogenase electron transfer subunit [Euryarchaeota archaeon]